MQLALANDYNVIWYFRYLPVYIIAIYVHITTMYASLNYLPTSSERALHVEQGGTKVINRFFAIFCQFLANCKHL